MATSAREELAEALGADPPGGIDALTEAEIRRLADIITKARIRQDEGIRRAEADIVGQVPRPLRGTVRRLLR